MDPSTRLKFIKIFNEFPVLWDKTSAEFSIFQKKATFREETWQKIVNRFYEEKLNLHEDKLKQLWSRLRNDFVRYKFPQNASKGFVKDDHEERLHKSLDIMSQQFFREEPFTQNLISPIELESSFDNQPTVSMAQPLKTRVNPKTYSSTLRKRTSDDGYHSEEEDAKKRTIGIQTEVIKREIGPRITRSKDELATIRVTFSTTSSDKLITLHENVKDLGTQYDEVATGPDYSTLGNHFFSDSYVQSIQAAIPYEEPYTQSIVPENDQYTLQSL